MPKSVAELFGMIRTAGIFIDLSFSSLLVW